MKREICAGILFVTKNGEGLFLKRTDHGDFAGFWGLPGGHLKKGETTEEGALRETEEEIGYKCKDPLKELNDQRFTEEGDEDKESIDKQFVTFLCITEKFDIKLNLVEHSEYVWADLKTPPEPIHPGLAVTLKKIFADELEIARMMASGDLPSPQHYMNLTLFNMRITGTGLSYRSAGDEYVWRDSSIYMNDDFLARCNGLPVLFEHPQSKTLNTKEYVDRNIGSVFLPYYKGDDEIWGVVKVWDKFAADIMEKHQLSTSPAVVLYGDDTQAAFAGKTLLIEGKPRLLDHLAICQRGVWDKSGPPVGVSSIIAEDLIMADEDSKAAALEAARKAKDDADAENIKKVINCLDSLSARMDAFQEEEKKRADAKAARKADKAARKADQAKADAKAKADAEEEEKKKADAKAKTDAEAEEAKKKADAEGEMRKRLADVEARLPKQMTDADYAAMADAQVRCDRICLMHGKRAPRPWDGETLVNYRRRLAGELKEFSDAWKVIDLSVIATDDAFKNVEDTIYADAERVGLHPPAPPEDFLREIINEDITGRKISTFVGKPSVWMSAFSDNKRKLVGIRN